MAFLDELGLDRLWQNIVAKLNNKIKTEVKVLDDKIKNKLDLKMNKVNPIGEGSFHMNPNEAERGEFSSTLGFGNKATSHAAHAEGYYTTASGDNSHAEGYYTKASSDSSHAEGYYTKASGDNSHAEGNFTTASGDYSHAEGKDTTASGHVSHAEGCDTIASGSYCHAEGQSTSASGGNSHAEGGNTEASGSHSHAEGSRTTASGANSHAEGYGTTASSGESHAEGSNTIASHWAAHAEGNQTTASAKYSHAEGSNTIASGESQHAQGKYNIEDSTSTYAHIVGNGKNTTIRSNAHTLDWKGNAWYQGDVYVGSTSGKNKDEGSKKLATEGYVNNTLYKDLETQDILDQSIMDKYWWYVPLNAPKIEVYYQGSLIKTFNRTNMSTSNGANMWKYGNDEEADATAFFDTYSGSDCERLYYDESGNSITAEYREREAKLQEGEGKCFTYMFGYLAYLDEEGNWVRPNDWFPISCAKEGNFAKAINFALKYSLAISELATEEYVNNAIVQSDWNQNDETALDFIKNKPDILTSDVLSEKMNATDPVGSGTFSMGRMGGTTIGAASFTHGGGAEASGFHSYAKGLYPIAKGEYSHAEGYRVEATGDYSYAFGDEAIASGKYAYSFGEDTEASSNYSHAEGYHSIATTDKNESVTIAAYGLYGQNEHCAHAEGYGTVACGIGSHTEGLSTKASGEGAHAEGRQTVSSGTSSHAEGYNTTSSGIGSHSEGQRTSASGGNSHAEGLYTTASGTNSHAEGYYTTASGTNSHAEGEYSEAAGENQHVEGKYNALDENNQFVHIIGNGTYSTRSNAHTVDWNGNAWYSGDVYVGSTSGTNKDEGSKKLATEEYVDTSIANLSDFSPDEILNTLNELNAAIANKITVPQNAVAGDLLTYDGTNWVRISRADLIAEIIAALPNAEEASF